MKSFYTIPEPETNPTPVENLNHSAALGGYGYKNNNYIPEEFVFALGRGDLDLGEIEKLPEGVKIFL